MTYYFEDLREGQTHEFGNRMITRNEIIEFAERYDPQPFHLNSSTSIRV